MLELSGVVENLLDGSATGSKGPCSTSFQGRSAPCFLDLDWYVCRRYKYVIPFDYSSVCLCLYVLAGV